MYEKSKENQSVRIFVGPCTAGDLGLFSAWFLSSDLGVPRVLPAVAVAGGMLASGIRNTLRQLALWASKQKDATRARTTLQPVRARQEAKATAAPKRRDEAA